MVSKLLNSPPISRFFLLIPHWKWRFCNYLTALFCQSILAGWLLSDYSAPHFIWAGTVLVTFHLAWVGFDAVFLAITWLVGIVWAGAIANSWPMSFHRTGIAVWAGALVLSWILGLLLILILAFTHKAMNSFRWSKTQRLWVLIGITWLGLSVGWIVNS